MTIGAPCMHACTDHTIRVHWNVHFVSMQSLKTTATATAKFAHFNAMGEWARDKQRNIDCNIPIKATAQPIPASKLCKIFTCFIFDHRTQCVLHTNTHGRARACSCACERSLFGLVHVYFYINIGLWMKKKKKYLNSWIFAVVAIIAAITSSLPLTLSAKVKFARHAVCVRKWLGANRYSTT